MSALLVILAVLAWTVLALLGLGLVVLLLPFHLRVHVAVWDGEPSGAAGVRWAFGAVAVAASPAGVAVRVAGAPIWRRTWRGLRRREEPEHRQARQARRKERREERAGKSGRRVRTLRGHRRTLLWILARFARALHLRLRAAGAVGLYDPVHTAALVRALELLGRLPVVELELEIDWLDETLEGEAVGSARVWVPELLAAAVALLFERRSRAVVWALASGT